MFYLITALIAFLLGLYLLKPNQPILPTEKSYGTPEIGDSFTLLSHNGEVFSSKDSDKFKLIFFGFTNCPNICPTSLYLMSDVAKKLGKLSKKLQLIFVTVDPERDTKEVIAKYLKNFPGKIIGLTGTTKEIGEIAGHYKLYYQLEKESPDDNDYMVNHSGLIYLMNTNDKYLMHFNQTTPANEMVLAIKEFINGKK